MSHREKSLTPWIMPSEPHDRTVLPPALYDRCVAEGCDMKWFIRQEPMPMTDEQIFEVIDHKLPTSEQMRAAVVDKVKRGERLGAFHDAAYQTGTEARVTLGSLNYTGSVTGRFEPSDKPKWDYCPGSLTRRGNPVRKSHTEKNCGGDVVCLPGLNGKCTACVDDT